MKNKLFDTGSKVPHQRDEKKIPPDVELIAKIFNELTDEYSENNKIIFLNEATRAAKHFDSVSRGVKSWARTRRCMVPNCLERSISRSHSIPKGMSISVIAENGHVLEPHFDHRCGEVRMRKVGNSLATTFPGFCKAHELMFEGFENRKTIGTAAEIYLQTYRAACRELFRARFVIEQHDWTMQEYCKVRDLGLLAKIKERAQRSGITVETVLKKIAFEYDPIVEAAKERLAPVRELATHIQDSLLPALENAVFKNDDSGIHIIAQSYDFEVPVALVGAATFYAYEAGREKPVTLLLNIIPHQGSTLVIFSGIKSESKFIEEYKSRWGTHALVMLSMLESWMINGTDQWCITPSTWENLPFERRSELFKKLMAAERNIGQECQLSIFDNIRRDLIIRTKAANSNDKSEKYFSFISSENAKMTSY
jgi:hypothetical protein